MSQDNTIIKILHRVDAPEQWNLANPILSKNEIGYETNGKFKIGDGSTNWKELSYAKTGSEVGIANDINGEIFNDYENNQAISPFSHAEGTKTQAGIKGYYYSNIVINEDGTAEITLTDNQQKLPATTNLNIQYTVNEDIISVVNGSKYPDCAKIIEINGNVIKVDKSPFGAFKNVSDPDMDDLSLYVYNKPNAGIVNLGWYAHAEGEGSQALERAAHAEGRDTKAKGQYSHTEGRETEAAYCGHAEGRKSKATNEYSHAEGSSTTASGKTSHAEGASTQSIGDYSHSEGQETKSKGARSHAEGWKSETKEEATAAHAEGYDTRANGLYSHSEGRGCRANGESSHAEGHYTIASSNYQHVQGKYNVEDKDGVYAHIVGNGYDGNRRNIHTLDWDGNAWFQGNIAANYVSARRNTTSSDNDLVLVTKGYLTKLVEDTTKKIFNSMRWTTILPQGYQKAQYIQSSGSQYIDIGYVLTENDSIEMDYELLDLNDGGDKFLLGVSSNTSEIGSIWVETYGAENKWYCRYGSSASANATFNNQGRGTLIMKKGSFSINEIEVLQTNFKSMPNTSITIFGRKNADGQVSGRTMRIGGFRVKNGEELKMDLIPCIDPNNKIGMYDMVSKTFFENNGSGSFVCG